MRFQVEAIDLPEGVDSTNRLMTRNGLGMDAQRAVNLRENLLGAVSSKPPRFGLLKDNLDDLVGKLEESMLFAEVAAARGARFRFQILI
jgi:hypothetical protein